MLKLILFKEISLFLSFSSISNGTSRLAPLTLLDKLFQLCSRIYQIFLAKMPLVFRENSKKRRNHCFSGGCEGVEHSRSDFSIIDEFRQIFLQKQFDFYHYKFSSYYNPKSYFQI